MLELMGLLFIPVEVVTTIAKQKQHVERTYDGREFEWHGHDTSSVNEQPRRKSKDSFVYQKRHCSISYS